MHQFNTIQQLGNKNAQVLLKNPEKKMQFKTQTCFFKIKVTKINYFFNRICSFIFCQPLHSLEF